MLWWWVTKEKSWGFCFRCERCMNRMRMVHMSGWLKLVMLLRGRTSTLNEVWTHDRYKFVQFGSVNVDGTFREKSNVSKLWSVHFGRVVFTAPKLKKEACHWTALVCFQHRWTVGRNVWQAVIGGRHGKHGSCWLMRKYIIFLYEVHPL